MTRLPKCVLLLAVAPALLPACGSEPVGGADGVFDPISTDTAQFWDRQTTITAELLQEITDEFNAGWDGLPIDIVQSGRYGDIHQKVLASIRAGSLPAMAVAYPSMVSQYAAADAVHPLDALVDDPELGLDSGLDDFFPSITATNRFEEFGNDLLSFPYTKSVLVMFYNNRVLRGAGLEGPPATWDDFLDACRQIEARTGRPAISIDVDASKICAMIFSRGGDVLDGLETRFDSPESIAVFELLEILVNEGLAIQNPPRTFNDETAFAAGEIAFIMRTSATQPHLAAVMEDASDWGIAPIPQVNPDRPVTVLYGANVCLFRTTERHTRAAWAFIRHFTSTENSVRWALATGYLPVRKSAAEHPDMIAQWEEWPSNRIAFDCLEFARAEPSLAAWQEVRELIEKAETAVLTGVMTGREAAIDLKGRANALLAARR